MTRVLFVCLGNICRSPAAEGIFLSKLSKLNLLDKFEVDSAGTSGVHTGELPDKRMCKAAQIRGYDLSSRSRKFIKDDFYRYDYIVVMDESNLSNILSLDLTNEFSQKVVLITDYCSNFKISGVPDPYYGGDEGFNHVIDILEDALSVFLKRLSDG
ncbi:low molecular weight protein-tyrosine-phosphatase [Halobacteriovorax sp. HLS]|uniref:low molecular weight protein-tyrosine-phosphatase n=1 Tax=Halobacteriovorax sp. HLS TaxID=2234000 RepID=UPI000FDB5468|nr:low molecular weight protein-tyrosine-phosphatase [Halobacteriovorax sp. HLS]